MTYFYNSSTICVFLEVTSGVSYEANKAVAKDSNQSVGDRVSSGEFCGWIWLKKNESFFFGLGVDAVKDKFDEKKSEASKEANKHSAENEAKSLVETVKEKAAGA